MNVQSRRRRSAARGEARASARIAQLPLRRVRNPYPPMALLSADQVEAIHEASMHILENLGIEVMSPRAFELLARAGASVDRATHERAHRPRHGGRRAGHRAARGGADAAQPGARRAYRRRRRSTSRWWPGRPTSTTWSGAGAREIMRDYCDLVRLAQHFNCIHMLGNQVCAPVELPANIAPSRHLPRQPDADRQELSRARRSAGAGRSTGCA